MLVDRAPHRDSIREKAAKIRRARERRLGKERRRMTTVLVADDHPLFREAIADALRTMFDRVGVLEAGSMTEAIDQRRQCRSMIDLVLLTCALPGMSGVKGVRTLRRRRPDIPIAVISALDDSMVVRSASMPAPSDIFPKSLPRRCIADAIQTILDGGSYRAERQRRSATRARETDDGDDGKLDDAMRCRFELPHQPAMEGAGADGAGPAQQADRLRHRRAADHGQGARLELVAEARGLRAAPRRSSCTQKYCRQASLSDRGNQRP